MDLRGGEVQSLSRALGHLCNMLLAKAFNSWRDAVFDKQHAMAAFLSIMRTREMRKVRALREGRVEAVERCRKPRLQRDALFSL